MPWNNNLTHLRDWFADRYYTVEQSRRIVVEAGLKPALISFNDQPVTNWFNILDHAMNQQAVDAVIDVAQTEYPTAKEWLEAAKAGILTGISGTDIKTDIAWNGADDPDKLEKIIGTRNAIRALLIALLEPAVQLREMELAGDFTGRLALMEELKTLPFGAVWDYYCLQMGVPAGTDWLAEVRKYESDVLSGRQ